MDKPENYNPLEKKHIGESVVRALLEKEVVPVALISAFNGAGIYALYYSGNFNAYRKIADLNADGNFSLPIYVGKADPQGGRKGLYLEAGRKLYARIKQHGDSVRQSGNLKIEDFHCRYLTVDDVWISLGERMLIEKYRPVWNVVIDGFGIHTPGEGRKGQKKSNWDLLHPGRRFAEGRAEKSKHDELVAKIKAHLFEH